ncbi:hypothetical protein GGF31_003476 [Allomyces arbusculus]|nr:hypothetical protein GGF31_003476 [Allomyces arbusculus]
MSSTPAITLPASFTTAPIATGPIATKDVSASFPDNTLATFRTSTLASTSDDTLAKNRATSISIKPPPRPTREHPEMSDKITIYNGTGEPIRALCTLFMGYYPNQWIELAHGYYATWQIVGASWHECIVAESVATGKRAAVCVLIGSEVTFYAVSQERIEDHQLQLVASPKEEWPAADGPAVTNATPYGIQVCRIMDPANMQWTPNERFQKMMSPGLQPWWHTVDPGTTESYPGSAGEVIAVQYNNKLATANSAAVATSGQTIRVLEPEPLRVMPPWAAGYGVIGINVCGTEVAMRVTNFSGGSRDWYTDGPMTLGQYWKRTDGEYEAVLLRRVSDGAQLATYVAVGSSIDMVFDGGRLDLTPPLGIYVVDLPPLGRSGILVINCLSDVDVDVRVTSLSKDDDNVGHDEEWHTIAAGSTRLWFRSAGVEVVAFALTGRDKSKQVGVMARVGASVSIHALPDALLE